MSRKPLSLSRESLKVLSSAEQVVAVHGGEETDMPPGTTTRPSRDCTRDHVCQWSKYTCTVCTSP